MRSVLLAGLVLLLASCGAADPPPAPPGPVHHLVLITLADATHTAALLEACAELGRLPGARGASTGRPLATARTDAAAEKWHVAFHAAFADEAAYAGWRDHPRHREIAALWKPRLSAFRVVDWDESAR